MNTKEAKDFLVQQAAEQAALENVPLSELEARMMYFVENDPTSCPNPVELNDEFEAKYDSSQYETKIALLLSHAYKRLRAESPQKRRYWDDAMSALNKGDHYLSVMWHGKTPNKNLRDDPGNKVIKCGTFAVFVFGLLATLANDPHIPSWVLACLGVLLFALCAVTMFFLAQQGYRALRRRKSD